MKNSIADILKPAVNYLLTANRLNDIMREPMS